ncbi:hypothetical protein LCGC14_1091670, partial [marine sediment metagenome]
MKSKKGDSIKELTDELIRRTKESLKEESNTLALDRFGYDSKEKLIYERDFKIQNRLLLFNFERENFKNTKPRQTQNLLPKISYGKGDFFIYPNFNEDYKHKTANYGHEEHYYNFWCCNIKVKKTKIEIKNMRPSQMPNEGIVSLQGWSEKEIDKNLNHLDKELKDHCIRVLKLFVQIHGGKTNFKPIPTSKGYEGEFNEIGGRFLNAIKPMRFYIKEHGRKSYNEPKYEHYTLLQAITRIKNDSLRDYSPEIAGKLVGLGNIMTANTKQITTTIANLGNITDTKLSKLIDATQSMADTQKKQYTENNKQMTGMNTEIKSHLDLVNLWKKEAEERLKPFFVRWWQYFK